MGTVYARLRNKELYTLCERSSDPFTVRFYHSVLA